MQKCSNRIFFSYLFFLSVFLSFCSFISSYDPIFSDNQAASVLSVVISSAGYIPESHSSAYGYHGTYYSGIPFWLCNMAIHSSCNRIPLISLRAIIITLRVQIYLHIVRLVFSSFIHCSFLHKSKKCTAFPDNAS